MSRGRSGHAGRLAAIGTAVKAKEDRLAMLLCEEDQIAADLEARKVEIAAVEVSLAKYRSRRCSSGAHLTPAASGRPAALPL